MNSNDIAGIFGMLMVFGIPIVAILTSHQRKMAMIFQQNAQIATVSPETLMLREELRELKTLVHEQSIAIDNLSRPLPAESRLQERVTG